jgi:putative ABC transport system substrate-binding protein
VDAFRRGLREHGYTEGKNVAVEYRLPRGRLELVPELAADVVRLPVDVIVTAGNVETRAARQATATIPIVMAYGADPVRAGFADSLARPGGNLTGCVDLAAELSPKRLQLLKEAVPGLSRVAVLLDPAVAPTAVEAAAQLLGLRLERFEVGTSRDLGDAFTAVPRSRPDALFVERHAVFRAPRAQIAEFALRHRLPTMFGAPLYAEAGGLLAYGVNYPDSFRRAAGYVGKILKGARAGDLPIEHPTRFDLVVNMKTARALGLAVPEAVLVRATQVIW